MAVGYSFDQNDSSALGQNPLAGLLSGGFNFSPQRSYGGSGNSLSSTPTATATLTPTSANTTERGGNQMAPLVPFADGLMGFGGGAATLSGSVSPTYSLVIPAAILGGAILLAILLKR